MGKYSKLSIEELNNLKTELKHERRRLDTKQLTIKVLINSAYG